MTLMFVGRQFDYRHNIRYHPATLLCQIAKHYMSHRACLPTFLTIGISAAQFRDGPFDKLSNYQFKTSMGHR